LNVGREVSDTSCALRDFDDDTSDSYCVTWATQVLLGVYLLIANVLLLNLLIAIFRWVWPRDWMVKTSACDSSSREFDSGPFRC